MSRPGRYKVPFTADGALVLHARVGSRPEGVVWLDNPEFDAVLTYRGFGHKRSSSHLLWADEATGRVYPMFLPDFDAVVRTRRFDGGRVAGRWTFAKRGDSYGVRGAAPRVDADPATPGGAS